MGLSVPLLMQDKEMEYYTPADLFDMKNLEKTMEESRKASNYKKEYRTLEYEGFSVFLQEIADIEQCSLSDACYKLGYSKNAWSTWKKERKAPIIAYWAAFGYFEHLCVKPKQENLEKFNFSNEELKEIVRFSLLSNGEYNIASKALEILKEREEKA